MSQGITGTFGVVRTVVFIVASVFALLELALGAAITNWTETKLVFGGFFSFAALAIATGILTILTLPVMLLFSQNRKGAIINMVIIEAGWTWFLWIMWISVGGSAAATEWLTACSNDFFVESGFKTVCSEIKALTAFGFLTWIILLGYNIFLFLLVIRQHLRGNAGVWTSYISETDFDAVSTYNGGTVEQKGTPAFVAQYPPHTTAQAGVPQQPTGSSYPQV